MICANCKAAQEGRRAGPCLQQYDCASFPAIQFVLRGGRQPTQAHPGSDAGWDMYVSEATVIPAGGFKDLPTGLYIALPDGWWGQILPRSSTLREHGLHIVPAVIDNGYRGELFAAAHNPNMRAVMVDCGLRLAQFIPQRIAAVAWREARDLPPSSRGGNGFGSSGR